MDQQVMQQRPAARPESTPPGKRMAGPAHARLTQFGSSLNARPAAQRVPNRTGLPDGLKAGVEALSGISMDHVRVHYNSGKPAQLNAHAYAQGSDIHLAPGQQRHLPHEAWHVVQQAQGRVKPTMQMKSGILVNDDAGLELEADRMGARGAQLVQGQFNGAALNSAPNRLDHSVQRRPDRHTPDLPAETLAAKSAEGPEGHQIDAGHLAHKGYRKLNRIAGQLWPINLLESVQGPLEQAITAINETDPAAAFDGAIGQKETIRAASLDIINGVIAEPPTVETAEQSALLGPLDYWSNVEHSSADVDARLKVLRFEMLKRDRLSVIAHRAMGTTNRSFGGLLTDDDPARQRPIENSPAAFAASLGHAAHAGNVEGTDGVECDVFLSRDGVAILSHDNHIADQMSAARRVAFGRPNARIEDLTAEELTALPRREAAEGGGADAGSVFMTLQGLLEAAGAVAGAYVLHTGKPFRVEIEMKGHNVGVYNIIDVTAKTISRFKKDHADQAPHLEIVMFNGTPGDVALHAQKRATKTKLGNLVVALGGNPAAVPDPAIDEYRSSLTRQEQVRLPEEGVQPTYISTYVLGAEHLLLDGVAPRLLNWDSKGLNAAVMDIIQANLNTPEDPAQVYTANQVALLAQKPLAVTPNVFKNNFKYVLGVERGRQNHAAHLAAQQQLVHANPTVTHILTDFPERVQDTRQRINPPVL